MSMKLLRIINVVSVVTDLQRIRSDQIPTELIKAGGETLNCEIYILIYSIRNKEKFPQQ
jgi:hypothetical protein